MIHILNKNGVSLLNNITLAELEKLKKDLLNIEKLSNQRLTYQINTNEFDNSLLEIISYLSSLSLFLMKSNQLTDNEIKNLINRIAQSSTLLNIYLLESV